MSDGDRILKLVGLVLVSFILIAVLTGVLVAMNPDIGSDGPDETDWSLESVNGTHVQITYEDGQPIPADELVVSVDGYDRHEAWSGTVEPGNTEIVRVAPDSVVRLYWVDERGHRDLLDSWQV